MRLYSLLLLIPFSVSCNFFSHNIWNIKIIKLGDSTSYVGMLHLNLPPEYDTVIKWDYYGDNEGADYHILRIQSKEYPPYYDTVRYKNLILSMEVFLHLISPIHFLD